MYINKLPNRNSSDEVSVMVADNIRLVDFMMRREHRFNFFFDDLDYVYSDMMMALVRAAELFDKERGFKFSTYACNAMRRRAERGIRDRRRKLKGHLVHNEYKDSWGDTVLHKIAIARENKDLSNQILLEHLISMLDNPDCCLSEREKFVLQRYYLDGMTLEKLGNFIGITKERVRQICLAATKKIKRQYKKREAA